MQTCQKSLCQQQISMPQVLQQSSSSCRQAAYSSTMQRKLLYMRSMKLTRI